MRTTLVAVAIALLPTEVAEAGPDTVMRALGSELDRTMSELRLGEEPAPYFVAFRLDDVEVVEVGASFGSLLRRSRSRSRALSCELRVGSPELDNTNFFALGRRAGGLAGSWNGSLRVPLSDDEGELRRHAWLAADEAYKQALEDLARKSAALESRRLPGGLADFTAAEPTASEEILATAALDLDAVSRLVTEVSAQFREAAGVQYSAVRLRHVRPTMRYLNSESSSYTRSVPLVELVVVAVAQADDGTPIEDVAAFYGRELGDLPGLDELRREASALAERVAGARAGATLERYNGPVLFTGQAAALVFHQVFAPATVGWRAPVSEDERLGQRLARLQGSLNDRLGGRVLARSMHLVDDPSAVEADGVPLYGGYRVDDEAVAASPTTIVERGILKTLLSSRNPSAGVPATTGNRRGAGVLPSNLLLSTAEAASEADLERELLTLVAERDLEFGVIVRRLVSPLLLAQAGGNQVTASSVPQEGLEHVVEAVKIYPDGREVRLRSLRFPALSAPSFRDLVAASGDRTVLTAPLRTRGGAVSWFSSASLGALLTGTPVVSVAVPDLLFEELTVTAPVGPVPRPPVVPHPHFSSP